MKYIVATLQVYPNYFIIFPKMITNDIYHYIIFKNVLIAL
jgi:hypothetical protein